MARSNLEPGKPGPGRAFWSSIYPKLLPLQVTGGDGGPLEHLHEIRRTIVRPGH
jgi:hypothetical protein